MFLISSLDDKVLDGNCNDLVSHSGGRHASSYEYLFLLSSSDSGVLGGWFGLVDGIALLQGSFRLSYNSTKQFFSGHLHLGVVGVWFGLADGLALLRACRLSHDHTNRSLPAYLHLGVWGKEFLAILGAGKQ